MFRAIYLGHLSVHASFVHLGHGLWGLGFGVWGFGLHGFEAEGLGVGADEFGLWVVWWQGI